MSLVISGPLTRGRVTELHAELTRLGASPGDVELDVAGVTEADSAGVALLATFARRLEGESRKLVLTRIPPNLEKTLRLFPAVGDEVQKVAPKKALFESVGERSLEGFVVAAEFVMLCADTVFFAVTGLFRRRGTRWDAVLYEMSAMGSRALGVVGLISFLVGGTMALQSAAQLRQFGANVFVADLIGISMTRELGPLMAAIVVAGRSGSAVAAEIGTMVISEEIDALKTMGLNPTRFVVVPKAIAITITQPLLTVLANLAGLFGGFLVAVTYLDVSPDAFMGRLQEAMKMKDLLTGLIKSVVFALLIVTVGAICGLRTRGGADAVGRSTTTSVVAGIFAVIMADAVASLVFYFGD
ncbi:MAG: MlaE family lipid ABC transporter permease subunit [Deltaproteobacteria bacterium]|nr:MlaE family lipid ABC transporter permease subunit [Deltaproteobacteria bacterium]